MDNNNLATPGHMQPDIQEDIDDMYKSHRGRFIEPRNRVRGPHISAEIVERVTFQETWRNQLHHYTFYNMLSNANSRTLNEKKSQRKKVFAKLVIQRDTPANP